MMSYQRAKLPTNTSLQPTTLPSLEELLLPINEVEQLPQSVHVVGPKYLIHVARQLLIVVFLGDSHEPCMRRFKAVLAQERLQLLAQLLDARLERLVLGLCESAAWRGGLSGPRGLRSRGSGHSSPSKHATVTACCGTFSPVPLVTINVIELRGEVEHRLEHVVELLLFADGHNLLVLLCVTLVRRHLCRLLRVRVRLVLVLRALLVLILLARDV
mmetsp:Transcript_18329/g.57794  ORF Transcript_18329/g.57794 Transcript_18329/m.57794 type:complete len:215 (-) Transcript_18329:597-1241(-)